MLGEEVRELMSRLPLTGNQRTPRARNEADESSEVLEGDDIVGTSLESKGSLICMCHRPPPYECFLERL